MRHRKKVTCQDLNLLASAMEEIASAVRFTADSFKDPSEIVLENDCPIAEIAAVIACLCEKGAVREGLPEWFNRLENETYRCLIQRGARTVLMSKYLSKKNVNTRVFLAQRGITIRSAMAEGAKRSG